MKWEHHYLQTFLENLQVQDVIPFILRNKANPPCGKISLSFKQASLQRFFVINEM